MYQDLVDRFNVGRNTKLKSARFRAILNCLSVEEGCQATLEMLDTEHNTYLSDSLCQKLAADIGREGWQQCHEEFCRELLERFSDLEENDQRPVAYVLGKLAGLEAMLAELRSEILPLLLASADTSIRTYAYKTLQTVSTLPFTDAIEASWQQYGDRDCALLIVKHCPVELQERQFDSLWAVHDRSVATSLMLNVEPTSQRLAGLLKTDGVTYAYICAKRGLTISDEEATKLWEQNFDSDRAGLLLWSFGQLKLYNFLTTMEFDRKKIEKPVRVHGA